MSNNSINRRELLKSTAFAAGVAAAVQLSSGSLVAAPNPVANDGLQTNDMILFQGDSITDANRNRKAEDRPNHAGCLGNGYPYLIAADILRENPSLNLKVYNRGISGHKVPDLKKRWDRDCLDLKPNVLSILVGVNDIWHKMNGNYEGTVATYETGFADLLKVTKQSLPGTTIVICEPFALRCGAVKDSWFPEFDQRRAVAKKVASDAECVWVPFQTMFDEAIAAGSKPEYWAGDGVHPSLAGHSLMAETWRKVVGV